MSTKSKNKLEELIAKIEMFDESDTSFTTLINSLIAHTSQEDSKVSKETRENKHNRDGRPNWIHFS